MRPYLSQLRKIFNSPRRGFTIIELVLVVAIIGILATIILAGLSTNQRTKRDAKRLADIRQLQAAIQLYYNAHNKFPATPTDDDCISRADTTKGLGNTNCAVLSDAGFTSAASSSGVIYMANIPKNPQPNGNLGGYQYARQASDGVITTDAYEIEFELEGKVDKFVAGDYVAYQDGIRTGILSIVAAGTWTSYLENTLYGPETNSSGNVGIGFAASTTPLSKLHVKGSAGANSLVTFQATSGIVTDKLFSIQNTTSTTSGIFTVLYSGNVGIGITAPETRLHTLDNTTTGPLGITIENDGASTSNLDMFRIISEVGRVNNVKLKIDSDGDMFTDGAVNIGNLTDIAENYPVSDLTIEAGDIVALTKTKKAHVMKMILRFALIYLY